MVEIRVDGLQELNQYFRQFERKLSNFQPFLRNEATSLLKNQIRDTFLNEGYGEWPPRRSGGSHPLLRKSGRYFRDATQRPIIRTTQNTLVYSVTTPYARIHEHGTGRIPRRSVFALSAERAKDNVLTSAQTYIAAIIRNPTL